MRRVLGSVAAAAGPAGLAAFLWATAPESAGPELRQLLPVSDLIQAFLLFPGLSLQASGSSACRSPWRESSGRTKPSAGFRSGESMQARLLI